MNVGLLAYAFSAGMVATVNPCGIAMLPAYISYYLATEEDISTHDVRHLWRALLVGTVVAAGFVVLFAVAGVFVSLGAYVLMTATPWIGLSIGVALTLLGIWLFAGNRLRVPGLPHLQVSRQRSLRAMFLYGIAYGLASLSCTLPIFLGVVGTAFAQTGVLQGVGQFLAYGLGMGAVLMGLTAGLALFREAALTSVRRVIPFVERGSAAFLAAAGVYIVYYWLTKGGLLMVLRDAMNTWG